MSLKRSPYLAEFGKDDQVTEEEIVDRRALLVDDIRVLTDLACTSRTVTTGLTRINDIYQDMLTLAHRLHRETKDLYATIPHDYQREKVDVSKPHHSIFAAAYLAAYVDNPADLRPGSDIVLKASWAMQEMLTKTAHYAAVSRRTASEYYRLQGEYDVILDRAIYFVETVEALREETPSMV
ncbi:unnamed protein product, partial [Mesorhabditis spiculigera]